MTAQVPGAMRSDRLDLLPLQPAHAELLFAPLAEPGLYRFMPERPMASPEALAERFRRLSTRQSPDGKQAWLNWVSFARASGAAVGTLQATVDPGERRASIAYVVFQAHTGQGYAREGVARMVEQLGAELGVRRVVAEIDTRNVASQRLVEALGFVRVRTVVAADFFAGASSDEFVYEREL